MNREALIALKTKVEAGLSCGTWTATETDFAGAKWNEVYLAHQGSLDAAKALHEAVLPGWNWLVRAPNDMDPFINHCNSGDFLANVWRADDDPNEGDDHYSEWSQIPARAWLLAVLSALIAMETHREEPREEPKEGY